MAKTFIIDYLREAHFSAVFSAIKVVETVKKNFLSAYRANKIK